MSLRKRGEETAEPKMGNLLTAQCDLRASSDSCLCGASSRPRFGPDPQRDAPAVVETGESLAWTPSASSALSASRIAELRRSLFIPCLPDEIELKELAARLTLLGNIQEIIVKRNQRAVRFGIVVFVEEESAFDALQAGLVVQEQRVAMEPRRSPDGHPHPPRLPRDTPTPLIVQRAPGGRGVPLSVLPAGVPVLSEDEAYEHHRTGRPPGAVAFRAPVLHSWLELVQKRQLAVPVVPLAGEAVKRKKAPHHKFSFLTETDDPCQQMRLLMERSQLSEEERDAREKLRRQLEATFRRCTVRLYGSLTISNNFFILFYKMNSNLSAVNTPMSYYFSNVTQLFQCPYEPWELAGESPKDILRLMEKLLRYLAKSENYEDVMAIPAARTPILKLRHPAAHLSVDVSFTSKLVFENTGLLILYSHLEPRLRPLVLTLRQWADAKELTGSEGLTKYALTLLLVFFLHTQEPAVLPPPDEIHRHVVNNPRLTRFLDEEGGFSFDLPERKLADLASELPPSTNTKTEADLLLDFFEYYSTFSFPTTVMRGWSGEVVPLSDFRDSLPPTGDPFKLRYVNLQDPFDLSHNIAKSVSLTTFVALLRWLQEEVAVFRRRALNLLPLLETEREDVAPPPVMLYGHHGFSCAFSAGRHPRHGGLNSIFLCRSLVSAGIPAKLEPRGTSHTSDRRPDGCTTFAWQRGMCLAWDVTCVDTVAMSHRKATSVTAGSAAAQAEDRKAGLYLYLQGRYIFVPLAFETLGPWGKSASRLVKEIGKRLQQHTGEPRSHEYLRQRLSLEIQRGNAASVLGTMEGAAALNELFFI
ncbi:speckle targeted PIP5K1A-regulated poly(A) polymerase-like [Paramacrobiotus metropolitanus]|uniref:speckle targeted PIP5K1A-regulated poly(A) polymerase-like n=1 Tax=Paramacrobiotus metropolitanus TaxID=2943436 RepID=UPI002445C8F5|nr:speckle targeted PIP5K1A-regulated poly(A) polymerase-like [Paramacrobiotus metropolitanus]